MADFFQYRGVRPDFSEVSTGHGVIEIRGNGYRAQAHNTNNLNAWFRVIARFGDPLLGPGEPPAGHNNYIYAQMMVQDENVQGTFRDYRDQQRNTNGWEYPYMIGAYQEEARLLDITRQDDATSAEKRAATEAHAAWDKLHSQGSGYLYFALSSAFEDMVPIARDRGIDPSFLVD